MKTKSGFKRGQRQWIHHPSTKERRLLPCKTTADRLKINGLLIIGWSKGTGKKGPTNRPPKKQVINTTTQETKWIPKSEAQEYLMLNPEWIFGSGKSYNENNSANSRGTNIGTNKKQRTKGYHFKAPRDWVIGSTRMFLPESDIKGRYVPENEVQELLAKGWIKGIRHKTPMVTCELCKSKITPQTLTHHPNNLCRSIQKKNLLEEMFQSQDAFDTPQGYAKSYSILGHPLYPRYKALLESLKP